MRFRVFVGVFRAPRRDQDFALTQKHLFLLLRLALASGSWTKSVLSKNGFSGFRKFAWPPGRRCAPAWSPGGPPGLGQAQCSLYWSETFLSHWSFFFRPPLLAPKYFRCNRYVTVQKKMFAVTPFFRKDYIPKILRPYQKMGPD